MQVWVVLGAWLFAVLFAVVVLGFVAYELSWKSRRLATDRAKLETLVAELSTVGAQLHAVSERLR
ncbi:MAG: hypothetical protein M3Y42_20745 [Actinomycetota bacterium]|nr:hypothetical protein [Actinomycetota bacterium]MDQ2959376.1 hypothetical protein [Actinomycetota bacterium]